MFRPLQGSGRAFLLNMVLIPPESKSQDGKVTSLVLAKSQANIDLSAIGTIKPSKKMK